MHLTLSPKHGHYAIHSANLAPDPSAQEALLQMDPIQTDYPGKHVGTEVLNSQEPNLMISAK